MWYHIGHKNLALLENQQNNFTKRMINLNLKRILALGLCLTLALTLLTGCAAKETSFTSTDGIVVKATSAWKQVSTLEDVKKLVGGISQADLETIDLALAKGDSPYFTIEKADCKEDYAAFVSVVAEIKTLLGDVTEEELLASLKEVGYIDDEIAILQKALKAENLAGDTGDLLYQESLNSSWFSDLEKNATNYAMVAQEEITILGKSSVLYEYKYTNDDKSDIHVYEANVKIGDTFYTLSSWTGQSQFAKEKEGLKTLITSATLGTPAAPATK